MTKVWVLLLTLSISTLFTHVPSVGAIGFPFNEKYTLNYHQYFYFLGEHLVIISMALIILDEAKEYRRALVVFVYLLLADFLTFILWYRDPLSEYILTFNILKVVIFGIAVFYEIKKDV
jgi:hypothetical protein